MYWIISYLTLLIFVQTIHSKTVTISNILPRSNIANGQIIDAHDGSIQQFEKGGLYYYHAIAYGLCKEPARLGCDLTSDKCGFRLDHNISVWSTPDLTNSAWKYEGNAIDMTERPPGTLFRPHVVFNPKTREYVLWWNYESPQGAYVGFGVAASQSITGPFKMRNIKANITREPAGDYDLFVDDDGTGYVIYSANYYMSIEKLTPDFVYSTGEQAICGPNKSALFPPFFVEAPVMFKRGKIYYALFGHCCCFCQQGSGIMVYTATSPLGPWNPQNPTGDLACKAPSHSVSIGDPTPGQGCLYPSSPDISVTRSQQNFVIEVNSDLGTEYVWTGDRWQQAPDGIKGHEPQYWTPLTFNNDGSIQDVSWVDQFSLEV